MKMREGRGRAETAKGGARGSWKGAGGQQEKRTRECIFRSETRGKETQQERTKSKRRRKKSSKAKPRGSPKKKKRKKKSKNELEGAEIYMWVECLS